MFHPLHCEKVSILDMLALQNFGESAFTLFTQYPVTCGSTFKWDLGVFTHFENNSKELNNLSSREMVETFKYMQCLLRMGFSAHSIDLKSSSLYKIAVIINIAVIKTKSANWGENGYISLRKYMDKYIQQGTTET